MCGGREHTELGDSILSAKKGQTKMFGKLEMTFKLLLLALLLFVSNAFGYTEGAVLVMSTGATTLTVNNSGSLGGSQTITLPVSGSQKGKVWLSTAGYPQRGSEQTCASPCSISMNTEYGQVSYWYELTDSNGNPLSPRKLSSQLFLAITPAPCSFSPFTVPVTVHGFTNYTTCFTFNIAAGVDVSALRVWLNVFNLRNGAGSVVVNGGAERLLATTPVVGLSSDGSTCTFTTNQKHGLSVSNIFQLNFSNNMAGGLPGAAALNGSYTVTNVLTPTTLTASCSAAAGDWNTGLSGAGQDNGKTISKTAIYADEKRWFGGMNLAHETFQLMTPIGASEMIAGAANTLGLRFKGTGDISTNGLFHGYYADWAIVQPDVEISQIVVAGTNAVATTKTAHGYSVNDTVIIRDAPGPKWRFNGKCVITAVTATTFTFAWGCGMSTGTPGVAPYTTANGTYLVPTSKDTLTAPSPHMYAARYLIAKSAYAAYDPTSVNYGGNASNGQTVWQTTILKDPNPWIPNNQSLGVCADCHTKDGSDLKYFGFGQRQVLIAGMHRGLSESDAKDVAAFIASNPTPTPTKGRPWNPTYQPAPGLDSRPISEWAAGGGEEWTMVYDQDMREYVVPGGAPPNWTGGSYANWAQNATFNTHEMPVYIPMPTWMTWLPKMNPKDFFANALGQSFTSYPLWTTYQGYLSAFKTITLSSSIAANATSMTVSDGTAIANNDFIQLDNEYFQVTAGGGTTSLTVSPHQKGSTAAPHTAGVFVSDFTTFVNQAYIEQAFNLCCSPGTYDFFEPQHLPGGAGNLQAAGLAWPSQYGPAFYDGSLWVISRKWEILNRFWLQNVLDQTYVSINGSPNPRAAPMYTRGWYNQMVFNVGPHKAISGSNLFRNRTAQNNTNWSRETARWYHMSAILDPGDRFAQGNFELDWPYYYAFNNSLSLNRPAKYMWLLADAFEIQNTWGWPLPFNANVGSVMTLHALRLNFSVGTVGSGYPELFTSESELAELVSQVAAEVAAAVDPEIFSTANWQFFFAIGNPDGCTLSHTPQALQGYLGSTCNSDALAYGLAVMNHYGVASSTLSKLVTWGNAVWAASGHDFATDAAATCSHQGAIPQTLQCSNF